MHRPELPVASAFAASRDVGHLAAYLAVGVIERYRALSLSLIEGFWPSRRGTRLTERRAGPLRGGLTDCRGRGPGSDGRLIERRRGLPLGIWPGELLASSLRGNLTDYRIRPFEGYRA